MLPFTSPVGSSGRLIEPQYPSYVELQYFSVTVPTVMVFGGEGAAASAGDAEAPSATMPATARAGARIEDGRRVGIVNPCWTVLLWPTFMHALPYGVNRVSHRFRCGSRFVWKSPSRLGN